MVVRVRSQNDRRQSIAQITQKGIDKLAELKPFITAHEQIIAEIFTAEDLEMIRMISSKIFKMDQK